LSRFGTTAFESYSLMTRAGLITIYDSPFTALTQSLVTTHHADHAALINGSALLTLLLLELWCIVCMLILLSRINGDAPRAQ
jgi:uncharacterized membrane protein YpjA